MNTATLLHQEEKERARQMVERFVRRFEESYRLLAYHAALPLVLTPELVNYLRVQFLRGDNVPWVAEVDLLLSDLCRQVGYELYAMDTAVRACLLEQMEQEERLGKQRMQEVAKSLIGYVKYLAQTNPYISPQELQTQQWAAMVYLDTHRETAVSEIAQAFQNAASQPTGIGQSLVNRAELARLARITQELTPQLSAYDNLVRYAELVGQVLTNPSQVEQEALVEADYVPRNNDKIRIYELSRELNLDNKELLEIAEQLNIAIKAYSSRITESQANLIRSVVQQRREHLIMITTGNLSPRERDILWLRYGLDDGRAKTLEEVGYIFQLTRERARQIEVKALRKLRKINFPLKGERQDDVATGHMRTQISLDTKGNLYATTRIWNNNRILGFTGSVFIALLDVSGVPIWVTNQHQYSVDSQYIGKSDRMENWQETIPADILARTKGYAIVQGHTPQSSLWEWLQSEDGQKIIKAVAVKAP